MAPASSILVLLAMASGVSSCAPGQADLVQVRPSAMTAEMLPEEAWSWRLRDLEGRERRFEEFRGGVLFVNVWASWCPPCVAELSAIERLAASLPDSSVAIILVSPEQPDVVRRFLSSRHLRLVSYVESTEMPDAFGLRAVPTTFVIDRGGRLVLRQRGAALWDTAPVRALLSHLATAPGDAYAEPAQAGARPR